MGLVLPIYGEVARRAGRACPPHLWGGGPQGRTGLSSPFMGRWPAGPEGPIGQILRGDKMLYRHGCSSQMGLSVQPGGGEDERPPGWEGRRRRGDDTGGGARATW